MAKFIKSGKVGMYPCFDPMLSPRREELMSIPFPLKPFNHDFMSYD